MENHRLLLHSLLHCHMSFPTNPTIYLSFLPSFPPAFPYLPSSFLSPLWVSDTQGIVRVHVPLCTSRMLLPSGGIPSAPDYVVRDGPQEGVGKTLMGQLNNTLTYILYLNKHRNMNYKPKSNSLMHASKNHVYSLAMGKSVELGTTRQCLSHRAWCQYFL